MQGVDVKPKRTLGIGLAVAIALLTSACAAGQEASTANEKNTIDGVNADVGPIHIRGMVIDAPTLLYKKNDSATVKVVLVNTSAKPDQLTSLTSPAITDWGTFNTAAAADAVLAAGQVARTAAAAHPAGLHPSRRSRLLRDARVHRRDGVPELHEGHLSRHDDPGHAAIRAGRVDHDLGAHRIGQLGEHQSDCTAEPDRRLSLPHIVTGWRYRRPVSTSQDRASA